MQSIGEKLEEARKRRGISIREASEILKIRSEYLGNFENNSFNLNVPEVYIRGFLRSYAEYLKLDGDKIITDYNAWKLGESSFVRQERSRGSLGRMDLDEPQPAQRPAPAADDSHPEIGNDEEDSIFPSSFNREKLLKSAGAIAAAALVVALIVTGIVMIFSSPAKEVADSSPSSTTEPAPVRELTVIATGGDIASVIVKEVSTGEEIFRGSLNEGMKQRIPYDQQVEIRFTDAQFLGLETNEREIKFQAARGPGRIIYPPN